MTTYSVCKFGFIVEVTGEVVDRTGEVTVFCKRYDTSYVYILYTLTRALRRTWTRT